MGGRGCHSHGKLCHLIQKICSKHSICVQVGQFASISLQSHGLYSPWNSAGQNTGVGSLSLLQGIFPTQELKPSLRHCRHFKIENISIHYHFSLLAKVSELGSKGLLSVKAVMQEATAWVGPSARFKLHIRYQSPSPIQKIFKLFSTIPV